MGTELTETVWILEIRSENGYLKSPPRNSNNKQFKKKKKLTNKKREKEKREFSRNGDKFPPTKMMVRSVSRMAYQQ